jgi:hypothetical protein
MWHNPDKATTTCELTSNVTHNVTGLYMWSDS